MATGVLPIMLGGATRFLNYLPDSDKGYRAEFMLGKTTDTLDITGNVTGEYEVNVSLADVEASLDDFKGEIEQLRLCIRQSVLTVRDFMTWHAGALKLKGRQEKLKSSHFRFAKNFQMKRKCLYN